MKRGLFDTYLVEVMAIENRQESHELAGPTEEPFPSTLLVLFRQSDQSALVPACLLLQLLEHDISFPDYQSPPFEYIQDVCATVTLVTHYGEIRRCAYRTHGSMLARPNIKSVPIANITVLTSSTQPVFDRYWNDKMGATYQMQY